MIFVIGLWTFLRALCLDSEAVALENLALRHQLLVLQRSVTRPRLSRWDRILWVWLSRLWTGWRRNLLIVQPATVLGWHRQGFQLYWRWRSTGNRLGRPRLDAEICGLIRRMARENPTWGRRRIQAELALLGYEVAELTVAKYMHRTSPRPSPTWRAFLAAHARELVAIDFFVVPTLTFRLLFVFVVLRHDRRELLHLNVTDHPTADWTARQILQTFPEETAPRYMLRDRDTIYGESFTGCIASMGIREVLIAPRAPWQNAFVERVIGSLRRECLDHFLILSEAHSADSCAPTSPTTTPRGHTNHSTTTVLSPESSNPHHVAGSSPFLRSAGSITVTSAPPDHHDRDPPFARSSGPAGCPPAVWRSTVAPAPTTPCSPSHPYSEDAASGPGRFQLCTEG